jgi:hypothetical protein
MFVSAGALSLPIALMSRLSHETARPNKTMSGVMPLRDILGVAQIGGK